MGLNHCFQLLHSLYTVSLVGIHIMKNVEMFVGEMSLNIICTCRGLACIGHSPA